MGTSYLALPLDDEIATWVKSLDRECPSSLPASRAPTLSELKKCLLELDEYEIEIKSSEATNSLIRILSNNSAFINFRRADGFHQFDVHDALSPSMDRGFFEFLNVFVGAV